MEHRTARVEHRLAQPIDPAALEEGSPQAVSPFRQRRAKARPVAVVARRSIVALDLDNLTQLRAMRPAGSQARLSLLLDHVAGREGEPVADPYHGGDSHFDATWRDVSAAARALAEMLAKERAA